ncbi:hypothetical protein [Prauserella flavalba]|uniref:Uncharacterized protein n=1 Tax=Prauserella flavalba TaxID=1477506 RepID=A0A318LHV9_9PSEU|nr:hypothetical protein [Prauserella flavalba]PXY20101.1 hypothetical protein BA062_33095 [Prauserella flavalba]
MTSPSGPQALATLPALDGPRFQNDPARLYRKMREALAAVDQVELGTQMEQIADRLIDSFAGSDGEHGCPYPAQEIAATIVESAIEVLLDRLPVRFTPAYPRVR